MKKSTFFIRFLRETRLGLVISCLLIAGALTQTLSAATYTAVKSADINTLTTWSATSAIPIPVSGDANIWSTGAYALSSTLPATFNGGTLNIATTGILTLNGSSSPATTGVTLTLNNLTLNGGTISSGAYWYAVTLNLNNNNFTLNSGTIQTNSNQGSRNILVQNANLAGSGNITIAQYLTKSVENWVEFTSTGVTTSGFTGTFTVVPGVSSTGKGGELKISAPTSGTFGVIVPAASASPGVVSNGITYTSTVAGKLFFNPGAGNTCTLASLNLGGTNIAAGTYTLAQLNTLAGSNVYLNQSSTGTVTVTGPVSPNPVLATPAANNSAAVGFTLNTAGYNPTTYTVTPNDVTNSTTGTAVTGVTTSPIWVTGLTNGHNYTFTVTATDALGATAISTSNQITASATSPITAIANGEINTPTTWSATSAIPIPVSGDANNWSTGAYVITETATLVTFNGGTFNIATNGKLNMGAGSATLNLNNLTLNGGIISNGANGNVTLNLITNTSTNTFTLNSGTIQTNSGQLNRNVLFTNCTLAGSGNTTISQWNVDKTNESFVEFTNTGVTTSGFTGTFTVTPGVSGTTTLGGELKLSCPTSGTFGVVVPAVNTSTGVISNGITYKGPLPGKLFFNPGAGNTCTLASLNLGGINLAPATYSLTQLQTAGYTNYLNSNSTGSVTVIGSVDAPTAVVATAGNTNASVAFIAPVNTAGYTITGYTVTPYDVTTSTPGTTATGTSSPITVTGLTNGHNYTFTVTATYAVNVTSAASAASSPVTPSATANIIQVNADNTTSALTLTPVSDISVAAGQTLTVDGTTNVNTITVAPTGKLTLGTVQLTTATNGIILQSDATGTGTLVDNTTSNPQAVTGVVNQYLPQGRNWYLSSPVSSGNSSNLTAGGLATSVSYWNEVGNAWVNSYSGSLTPGLGYIAVSSAGTGTNNAQFSGTFNTGSVPVTLTSTGTGTYAGFNLVANPYPSYLSWQTVNAANAAANMPTGTIWYRTVNYNGQSAWLPNTSYNVNDVVYNGTNFYIATTAGTSAASGGPSGITAGITDGSVVWAYQSSIYIFATVNASGVSTPSTVSNLIPPMQAFWVRTNTGGGTLTFTNAMRSHNTTGGTDAMKARKSTVIAMPLLRLNVTNGASADESVIYASDNASNDFDSYDAPKYFNTASYNQPQIYTQIGNEKLAINAVKGITYDTEIPLGFTIATAGNFSIKASQFSNFDAGTQVILKDYLDINQPVITDLSNGTAYTFSSDAVNTTNRFSIIFKSASIVSALNNTDNNSSIFVYKNANNQISVNIPAEMIGKASVSVFNAVGQKLENKQLFNSITVLNGSYTSGIYLVSVVGNRKTTTRKVVIN